LIGLIINTLRLCIFSVAFFVSIPVFSAGCVGIKVSQQVDECAKISRDAADKSLNDSYAALVLRAKDQYRVDEVLEKKYLAILLSSQRAWIKLRDTNCELDSFLADAQSPVHETLINACVATMSQERSQYIERALR
jgi:uncharacterized protein YecT (DUF1311 family)